jgi:hypothetical protein
LTDQDALQVVLTGFSQVSPPKNPPAGTGQSLAAVLATNSSQGLSTWSGAELQLKRRSGSALDVNTRLNPALYSMYASEMRARGLSWSMLPQRHFPNGPQLASRWESLMSHATPKDMLTAHFNCLTKPRFMDAVLEAAQRGGERSLAIMQARAPPNERRLAEQAGITTLEATLFADFVSPSPSDGATYDTPGSLDQEETRLLTVGFDDALPMHANADADARRHDGRMRTRRHPQK